MTVKELRDEIDEIITQKYRKIQELPYTKEKGLKGNVEKFRNKKEKLSRHTQQKKLSKKNMVISS